MPRKVLLKAQKRLNPIHLLLCGADFELTRTYNAVSERCLQKWIKAFNEKGIDGITYKPRTGCPRILPPEDVQKKILPLVEEPK